MNMNMETAREFLEYRTPTGITNDYPDYWEAMIEFAKIHVQAALEAAAQEVDNEIEKDFITGKTVLNAYSLDNIK